jgi:gas vesicle protein
MDRSDIVAWFADALPFQRRRSGRWIVPAGMGLGVGIVVGIGLGVMLAPQSGYETRKQLRSRADRVAERARGLAHRARARGEAALGDVAARTSEIADAANDYVAR